MKLIIQHNGAACVVGLIGTASEIVEHFNGFWNHGATRGELTWGHDNFAHFWTTPKKLYASLLSRARLKLLKRDTTKYKGKKGGFDAVARRLANFKLMQMKPDRCLYIFKSEDIYRVTLGDMSDEWEKNYEDGKGLYKPVVKA